MNGGKGVEGIKAERPIRIETHLSYEERESFLAIAQGIDIPHCMLLRHLIRYAMKEETDFPKLMKDLHEEFADINLSIETSQREGEKKKTTIRTYVTHDLHTSFTRFTKHWDWTPGTCLRKLILLYNAGKIQQHAILAHSLCKAV